MTILTEKISKSFTYNAKLQIIQKSSVCVMLKNYPSCNFVLQRLKMNFNLGVSNFKY